MILSIISRFLTGKPLKLLSTLKSVIMQFSGSLARSIATPSYMCATLWVLQRVNGQGSILGNSKESKSSQGGKNHQTTKLIYWVGHMLDRTLISMTTFYPYVPLIFGRKEGKKGGREENEEIKARETCI